MKRRFDPITDRSADIIEYLMSSPDMPREESLRFKIHLAVEEAVDNIVRYAYDGGIGWLEAGTELDEKGLELSVRLIDAGTRFNPLEKEEPDLDLGIDERPVGGLGIFLCKELMDSIAYEYKDGCNVLTMKKVIA